MPRRRSALFEEASRECEQTDALLSTIGSLALACLTFSRPAFAEAVLRTSACSTLSKVTYDGRDYSIRN
jgi:hypothetical protein